MELEIVARVQEEINELLAREAGSRGKTIDLGRMRQKREVSQNLDSGRLSHQGDVTTNSSRRFFDQADSSCPSVEGFSSP